MVFKKMPLQFRNLYSLFFRIFKAKGMIEVITLISEMNHQIYQLFVQSKFWGAFFRTDVPADIKLKYTVPYRYRLSAGIGWLYCNWYENHKSVGLSYKLETQSESIRFMFAIWITIYNIHTIYNYTICWISMVQLNLKIYLK